MNWQKVEFDSLDKIAEECRQGNLIHLKCDTTKARREIIEELKLSLSWGRGVFYYTKGILVVATEYTDIDMFDKYYEVINVRKRRNKDRRSKIGSRAIITL